MVIKYHISPYPQLQENMVVRIWEAQSDGPNGWVYEEVLTAPHDAPRTITANGLDTVVHIVRLYTETTANKLHEYNLEPMTETAIVFDPIRFKIGDGGTYTPQAGAVEFQCPELVGLRVNDYEVFRNNYGFLFPSQHYEVIEMPIQGLGGFRLNSPDAFNEAEEITILRKTLTASQVVNDSVVGKWFGGFVDVYTNEVYKAEHLRKLIRFAGVSSYTFKAGDAIPVGYGFVFNHFGSFAQQGGKGTVNFSNAPLRWGNETKQAIEISNYQEACFVFDGSFWNVIYFSDLNFMNSSTQTQALPNTIVAAGRMQVGDLASGDNVRTVVHNKNVTGDYTVLVNIESTANTHWRNNMVCLTWYHSPEDKPNRFLVSLQEVEKTQQDITINWLIVKL